jgi:hypothetical protein
VERGAAAGVVELYVKGVLVIKYQGKIVKWFNWIGLVLVGIFILFFGGGIFSEIYYRSSIILILVILAFTGGVILLNKN